VDAVPWAILLIAASFSGPPASAAGPADAPAVWRSLAPGLEVSRLPAPTWGAVGDSVVTVVRVDPQRYVFRLLSAELMGLGRNPTALEWVRQEGVSGVINAAMFRTDQRTALGYMRDGERTNNPRWSADNAIFVSQPRRAGLPEAAILDRVCDPDAARRAEDYRVVVQSIRMLDCEGRNVWSPQPRRWSTACVGTDTAGRVLLIHVRSPYTTHDLIDLLRSLPLDLRRLMYVEGGPEASLVVAVKGEALLSEVGSFETGFHEADDNRVFWPVPNVLAFQERGGGAAPGP
jgi:Phosphodiester glycosidase